MSKEQQRIRIELTNEQQTLVKEQSGIELPLVELTVEELEERIAPESISLNYGGIQWKYQ
jgi:hypothetical protein